MTAAVEQDNVTGLCFAQAFHHAIEVQRVVCCVVVIVFHNFQTRGVEYAFMVRPAWITHPYSLSAGLGCDKICCDTQAACTTWRLCRTCTLVCDDSAVFPEQQLLSTTCKIRQPINAQVSLGRFVFQQKLLSFFHAGQNRRFARFIFINTNPKIDFILARVSTKKIGKTENRISRCSSDFFKHREDFHGLIFSRKRASGYRLKVGLPTVCGKKKAEL